jgi:hypothetical protein
LSDYGWQHAYAITDLSLGVGRIDKRFDLNVIVRNLFNVTRGDAGWSSITIYQRPRWVACRSAASSFDKHGRGVLVRRALMCAWARPFSRLIPRCNNCCWRAAPCITG